MMKNKRQILTGLLALAAGASVAAVDLKNKELAEKLPWGRDIKGPFGLLLYRRSHNEGAAMNLLEKYPQLVTVVSIALTAFCGLVFLGTFTMAGSGLLQLGLALLLGGGFSNTCDRLRRKYVVDYFSFNVPFKGLRRIVFNLGDFGIFVGAMLICLGDRKVDK